MSTVNPDFAAEPLHQRLAAYLAEGGETQTAFARRCGVPQPTLSKFLRGKARLEHDQFLAVVTALPNASLPAGDEGGSERRSPDREPAAPPFAPASLTHAEIHPSPLNPRKTFDADALAQLAESIHGQGLLQNLVVRRAEGRWVLVAGERRWRAIGLLVDLGVDTAAIADRISRSRRHVQLRLRLTQLDGAVQDALDQGKITLATARVLTVAPAAEQPALLARVLEGAYGYRTAEELSDQVRRGWVPAALARFDLAAVGLETAEGEDGQPYVPDRDAFVKAQKAWAKTEATRLRREEGWSFVKVEKSLPSWNYERKRSKDPKTSGVVIAVAYDGKVAIHRGLVPKAADAGEDEAARQARFAAQRRNDERREAFDRAIVEALSRSPRVALAAVLHDSVCQNGGEVGAAVSAGWTKSERLAAALQVAPGTGGPDLLRALAALSEDQLVDLLATAAGGDHRRFGYHASREVTAALAQLLGVALPELEPVP